MKIHVSKFSMHVTYMLFYPALGMTVNACYLHNFLSMGCILRYIKDWV